MLRCARHRGFEPSGNSTILRRKSDGFTSHLVIERNEQGKPERFYVEAQERLGEDEGTVLVRGFYDPQGNLLVGSFTTVYDGSSGLVDVARANGYFSDPRGDFLYDDPQTLRSTVYVAKQGKAYVTVNAQWVADSLAGGGRPTSMTREGFEGLVRARFSTSEEVAQWIASTQSAGSTGLAAWLGLPSLAGLCSFSPEKWADWGREGLSYVMSGKWLPRQ